MSAEAVALGPDAQVDINGVPFGLTAFEYEISWEVKERTPTTNTSRGHRRNPYRKIEFTLTAQRQDDVSPHAAPLAITNDAGVGVRIWLYGRGDPTGLYDIPQAVVSRFRGGGQVAGSQPQSVSFSGVGDGDFFLPGE